MLARFTTGEHDPKCSGCPACRNDYAEMLDESPRMAAHRLRMATAAGVFRVSQPREEVRKTEAEWRDHFGQVLRGYGSVQPNKPADPYAQASERAPYAPCPFDDLTYQPHGTAPDGYALAIDRAKKVNT